MRQFTSCVWVQVYTARLNGVRTVLHHRDYGGGLCQLRTARRSGVSRCSRGPNLKSRSRREGAGPISSIARLIDFLGMCFALTLRGS